MSFIKLVSNLKTSNSLEKDVIHYIIENSNRVLVHNLSLTEVSKNTHVSRTSLLRILRKFGFENWTEFVESCVIEEKIEISQTESTLSSIHYQEQALFKYFKNNTIKNLGKAFKIMKDSKEFIIFGHEVAGNVAQFFSYLLNDMEIMNTHAFFENQLFPLLEENRVLVIFQMNENENFKDILFKSRYKKCKTIIFNVSEDFSYDDSFYITKVNIPLYLNKEARLTKILKISSLQLIMKYLFLNPHLIK